MTQLVAGLALHVVLGLALAAAVWGSGLGLLVLVSRDGALGDASRVFAYPLGLLALTVGAFMALIHPLLGLLSLLALLPSTVAALRARATLAPFLRDGLRRLAWASPGVVGLPVALGFRLHGPSETIDSFAFGDMVFYVAKVVSADRSVLPFDDLLVAGERSAYVEAGSSFLGAVLSGVPGFDVFLFHTTTLPTLALASIPIGLGLLGRPAAPGTGDWLPVVGLLAVTFAAYPTWLTETAPLALALPLTFSVYAVATERRPLPQLVWITAIVAIDYALTKGFGAIVVAVGAAIAFARDHARAVTRRQAAALTALALAVGGATLGFFATTSGWLTERFGLEFAPIAAVEGLFDQLDVRDTAAAGPGFELIGLGVLFAALVGVGSWTFAGVLAVALAGHWLLGGHSFDVLVGTTILMAALLFWQQPVKLLAQRWLVTAAAGFLAISAWFRDVSSTRSGLVFVVLLAVALVGAFAERRVIWAWPAAAAAVLAALAGRPFVGFAILVCMLLVVLTFPRVRLVAAAAALAAAAGVAASAEDLGLTAQAPTLTVDDYRVWREVEDQVPPDGLVFTSRTGPTITGTQGWNYYPGVAQRQLYLAGWANSPLLVDREELRRRLRTNEAVLTGRLDPRDLPAARPHGSYYAVVERTAAAPSTFVRMYENDRFALYEIR